MNNYDKREKQTIDILSDLRQFITEVREDFHIPEEGLPIKLGSFSFSSYTKSDLLTISNSLRSKNIKISFYKWYVDGESILSKVESYHDSEKDVDVGVLQTVSLGGAKYKIEHELKKLLGEKLSSFSRIDKVHLVQDLRNVATLLSEFKDLSKSINETKAKEIYTKVLGIFNKIHIHNFCINQNTDINLLDEDSKHRYLYELFHMTDALLCDLEEWDDDYIYFFDNKIIVDIGNNNGPHEYFFSYFDEAVLFNGSEIELSNKSDYKQIFILLIKNFQNGGEIEYAEVVKLYNQIHKKKINEKTIRDHIVNPSKGLQRRLKVLKISSLLGKRIFMSKKNDTSKFIFNNLKSSE